MKKIIARFNSKCSETGKPLKKGEFIYYDYQTKKPYHLDSQTAKNWESNQESRDTLAYVNAQETAYLDRITGGYYSR